MKEDTYTRIIPRDFFNEAKLLKCMGQLALKVLDKELPEGISIRVEGSTEPFGIEMEGYYAPIYVANYLVSINDEEYLVGTIINSKDPFPLVVVDNYNMYEVFNGAGEFSDEFIEHFKL